jgi:hypothetical protein
MESARITQGLYPGMYKEAEISNDRYCMDGFEKHFNDFQNLLQFTVTQDDSDEWFTTATSGITVLEAPKEPLLIKLAYGKYDLACGEKVLEDTHWKPT